MQYLLGEAGPEESSSLEERLVTDKEFYDELEIAEDELIDQYVGGDLTNLERERFESHFLFSPERRQKVRFGRALNKLTAVNAVEDHTVQTSNAKEDVVPIPPARFPIHLLQSNPILSYSLLALLVLGVGIASWFIWKQREVRPAGKTLAVTLSPGTTRSDSARSRISIPPDTEIVQLRLALDSAAESPRIRVINGEGAEVWSGDATTAPQNGLSFVVANVSAQSLPNGDYRVILSRKLPDGSFEEIQSYSFSVLP